jgi:hypothetical protein
VNARARLVAPAIAALVIACGASVNVEDDTSLCLEWPDGGAPQAGAPPPSLPCEDLPGIGTFGPVNPQVVYVCIAPRADGCPVPSEAQASFASCVEERSGPGCQPNPDGTFTQGSCSGRRTASACGPDPAAVGACCYYATLVDFEWIS